MPKFGIKNALFGYFWAGILENYRHILNQHLRICLNQKFCEETKMPKFGTKNVWFGVFLNWNLKTILSYLKSAPSNLSNCKISRKNKNMTKIWDQKCLIWARILKNYCHFWNQHLQICQKWVFNSYSEFWYRVRFF